jgi:uncharacterized protein YndB with AHSA1/START domain
MGFDERGNQMDQMMSVPPVRSSVTVRASRERAFRVFTECIGEWWPIAEHSIEAEAMTAVMDCRAGGRIVERHVDGGEANWGIIRAWEPPERLVFSWNPSDQQRPETEVEVNFTPLPDGRTRVDLEHRGWERLGDRGPESRRGYDEGWPRVLEQFAQLASATPLGG